LVIFPRVRVLVAEDFAPFRQFICSILATRANLEVVCAVADGLEAIQNTKILEPDMVLLDIGLPTLNGIEVARQIRQLAPESKIIFVSQESSAEVLREAFSLGAWGYVAKPRARLDTLTAVDAALAGSRFVSLGLSFENLTHAGPRPPAAIKSS
jgi:DNA-binding NarL/FixJ family response regulator